MENIMDNKYINSFDNWNFIKLFKGKSIVINVKNRMEQFRNKIDQIDEMIMSLLIDRYLTVKDIGEYKMKNNIPVLDKKGKKKNMKKLRIFIGRTSIFFKRNYKKMMEETKNVQQRNNKV